MREYYFIDAPCRCRKECKGSGFLHVSWIRPFLTFLLHVLRMESHYEWLNESVGHLLDIWVFICGIQ